ncbi:MAG: hypothetical protein HUK19_08275 [Fibrobacter sp.]|nr:hypothetical protein [Fibrobacter sp.]
MKKWIFALGVLFSVCAFAQEMDTTYAVTENGETVGLVHKRGMLPVVPQGMRLLDEKTVEEPVLQTVPAPQAVRVHENSMWAAEVDSVEYYQNLIDRNARSGRVKTRVGNWLMVAGTAATVFGGILFFDSILDDSLDGDGGEFLLGYTSALAGAGTFVAGFIIKRVGVSRTRRAKLYEHKLEQYKESQGVALSIVPQVNPVDKSLGGAVALNF